MTNRHFSFNIRLVIVKRAPGQAASVKVDCTGFGQGVGGRAVVWMCTKFTPTACKLCLMYDTGYLSLKGTKKAGDCSPDL